MNTTETVAIPTRSALSFNDIKWSISENGYKEILIFLKALPVDSDHELYALWRSSVDLMNFFSLSDSEFFDLMQDSITCDNLRQSDKAPFPIEQSDINICSAILKNSDIESEIEDNLIAQNYILTIIVALTIIELWTITNKGEF